MMKAKLLMNINISPSETIKRGEVVEILDRFRGTEGEYNYFVKTKKGAETTLHADTVDVLHEPTNDEDWCRYDLAKAALQGILGNEAEVNHACKWYGGYVSDSVAAFALRCADALINQIKDRNETAANDLLKKQILKIYPIYLWQ